MFSSSTSCVKCVFLPQYFPTRKCLEVTTGPSVTGTVEQLAMTSDPKVCFIYT